MRVCHLVSGDVWAGAEVQVATLLGALKRFPDLELSALLLNGGRLRDELVRLDIPVTLCDESRLGLVRLLIEVTRCLSKGQPQVLHTHGYKEQVLGAAAGRLSSRPKLVQTYHGLQENLPGWPGLKMRIYDRINAAVGRAAADALIGVSSEITRILQERHPSTEVRCIRNGIDTARVAPTVERLAMRAQLGIARDSFVVGSVGRLMPIKALDHLIEAFAQLRQRQAGLNAQLVMVGDGPLRSELEQCARRLGVAAEVSFLGARSDVYDVMACFDVFALSSLHEGIPMVILEAMTVGVPIVASRVGGIAEILEDGKDALLVPAGDSGALARAIETLVVSPGLRAAAVAAARERVDARFSIEASAASTRDLYRSLVKGAHR